jgi:hypothetical protein
MAERMEAGLKHRPVSPGFDAEFVPCLDTGRHPRTMPELSRGGSFR